MKQCAWVPADKYINAEDYFDIAHFYPPFNIKTSYGEFNVDGTYIIYKGFLYSANWPAINTDDSRRAAMVHDFGYSLMKDGVLSREFRESFDNLFYSILKEDGMPSFRAYAWLRAVQIGGEKALDAPAVKIIRSPRSKHPDQIKIAQILIGGASHYNKKD